MLFALEETKFEPSKINGRRLSRASPTENSIAETASTQELEPIPSTDSSSTEPEINCSIEVKSYWHRHAFYTASQNTTTLYPKRFTRQLYQPFYILAIFPAVMFSALQYAWSESMLSFLAVTQATLYPLPPYSFSAIGVGNMNIPPAIGAILGSIFGGPFSDYLVLRIADRRNGIYEPEYRLWTFLIPGTAMVAGVLMYGLTIAEVSENGHLRKTGYTYLHHVTQGMPWITNAIGAGLVGFALGGCGDIALTYVQDSYDGVRNTPLHMYRLYPANEAVLQIIGPALTGVVFVRNGMATVMTFVIPIWASRMGFYNMFALLGGLAALVALTCVPLMIWGRYWRVQLADTYAELVKDEHYR